MRLRGNAELRPQSESPTNGNHPDLHEEVSAARLLPNAGDGFGDGWVDRGARVPVACARRKETEPEAGPISSPPQ